MLVIDILKDPLHGKIIKTLLKEDVESQEKLWVTLSRKFGTTSSNPEDFLEEIGGLPLYDLAKEFFKHGHSEIYFEIENFINSRSPNTEYITLLREQNELLKRSIQALKINNELLSTTLHPEIKQPRFANFIVKVDGVVKGVSLSAVISSPSSVCTSFWAGLLIAGTKDVPLWFALDYKYHEGKYATLNWSEREKVENLVKSLIAKPIYMTVDQMADEFDSYGLNKHANILREFLKE